jgi:hypothetical protein
MCANALVHYRATQQQFTKLDQLHPEFDSELVHLDEALIQPIVLSGMCLEATLFDLSACLFGDEFAEQVDKLDPPSKFAVIARCVNGRAPRKDRVTYENLQSVIKARNQLVHHKSHSMDSDWNTIFERTKREHLSNLKGLAACFRAPVLLSLYFNEQVFEQLKILPSFEGEEWKPAVPVDLHAEVEWCRKAAGSERDQ